MKADNPDNKDTFQNNPTSWYYRLSKCMIEVLLPVIDLLAEDHGRKKRNILDSSFIDNYLFAAFTKRGPGASEAASGDSSSDGTMVPEQLPIPEMSLAEWDEYLKPNPTVYRLVSSDNEDTDSESGFLDQELSDAGTDDWKDEVPTSQVQIAEMNASSIEHDLSEAVLENLPQVSRRCCQLMYLESH